MNARLFTLAGLVTVGLVTGLGHPPPARQEPERHRSPAGLALLPGGRLAVTANRTADTVSLVDLDGGKVLQELAVGGQPVAVAVGAAGTRAAAACWWSGTVALLEIADGRLRLAATVPVGRQPRAVAFGPDGDRLFVAVAGDDTVAEVAWGRRAVVHRWPAAREPWALAVSADGRHLAAASARNGRVRLWDLATRQLVWERAIEDAFNLRGLVFAPDGQAVICAHVLRRDFPVSRANVEEGWVVDSRLTRLAVDAAARPALWQVALDTRGQAVGDPEGLAFSPDGAWLALAGSGTHELLFLPAAALPWTAGDPGDFIKPELAAVVHRVPVGGRPLAVAWRSAAEVVTANALADAVQAVDARHFRPGRAVALGGQEPDAARRGEALFYDATRAHHQWFSCHTCHVEGHTCGQNFDTLNDASYGNPKLTPTLRGVAHTGPWTWHGWQTDLAAGVRKSFADTLHGPTPSNAEVAAVVAYLETLRHPPPPTGDPEAVRRGEALFRGKARCARCHQGDNYTSPRVYDVGLEPDGSPYAKWNPPSLLGLADRGPYLHDGRAQTLEDVIANHHGPEKLEGVGLTAAERADLVAFLRTR